MIGCYRVSSWGGEGVGLARIIICKDCAQMCKEFAKDVHENCALFARNLQGIRKESANNVQALF